MVNNGLFTEEWKTAPQFVLKQILYEAKTITMNYQKAKDNRAERRTEALVAEVLAQHEKVEEADNLDNNVNLYYAQETLSKHLSEQSQ